MSDAKRRGGSGATGGRPPVQVEIAVVGAGVMGLWTAWHLRKRGHDVLLVDSWPVGHPRASSSGESRVIRSGYGGSTLYAEWAWRAVTLWSAWQARIGDKLFHTTGVLWMTGKDDAYAKASLADLERLRSPCERLEPAALRERYPQIAFEGIRWGILEFEAGAIQARRACIALARAFERSGGRSLCARVGPGAARGARLLDVRPESGAAARAGRARSSRHRPAARDYSRPPRSPSRVEHRGGARIEAKTFIFACGPWLPGLFPRVLGRKVKVTRKEVFFFGTPPGDRRFDAESLPVWLELGTGCYGIPSLDGRGFKLHPDVPGPKVDPDTQDRRPSQRLLNLARACLRRRFPDLARAPVVEARVCQYASTGDDHLVFDRHPSWSNAWIVGAGSGHGFKHGPVVGELVAEVVTGARSVDSIPEPLRLSHRASGRNF